MLGDRLKRLRKAQSLGTVEMAKRAGISRTTLSSVESGDPGPAIGTYLRVMSVCTNGDGAHHEGSRRGKAARPATA